MYYMYVVGGGVGWGGGTKDSVSPDLRGALILWHISTSLYVRVRRINGTKKALSLIEDVALHRVRVHNCKVSLYLHIRIIVLSSI